MEHTALIVAEFLQFVIILWLAYDVRKNRRLIRDLAKASKKLAEKVVLKKEV